MQTITYNHLRHNIQGTLNSENQIKPFRRDSIRHRAVFAAVREWESALPGKAQEKIAQLVAEKWATDGGEVSWLTNKICSGT